jgi:hypothetical protein
MYKILISHICCVLVLGVATNKAIAHLVAYYPLDEGSGNFAADASGNGHHGIIQGTPAWVNSKSGFGKALYFNGINPTTGWVNAGTWNPSEGTGQLTVTLWARWNGNVAPDGWQGLIGKRQGWTEDGSTMMWYIEIDKDSDTIAFHRAGSYLGSGRCILPIGEWTHIAVSFDGATGIFYVNGEQVNQGSFSFGSKTNATIAIGCNGGEGWNTFHGTLDDVRLYNNAISPQEIEYVMLGETFFAYSPQPPDDSMLGETSVTLSWFPGDSAVSHDVYFGESFEDVEAGTADTFQGNQLSTSFVVGLPGYPYPDGLVLGTTYYWRIDEIETNGRTIQRGDVWCFTIVPPGLGEILQEKWDDIYGVDLNTLKNYWKYPDNPDETKVITQFDTGNDLDDNYGGRVHGWLYAPFTGDYTFWLCTDDEGELWFSTDDQPANVELIAYIKNSPTTSGAWAPPYTWDKFDSQRSRPISLRAGQSYYIMAIWKEGTGWDHCQVAWGGPGISTQTIIPGSCLSIEPIMVYPNPANGARIGDKTPILRWSPRQTSVAYDVYFGTNLNSVTYAGTSDTSGIYRGRFQETSYATEELYVDQTYYWRVDDVEPGGKTIHKGDIWSFTVVDEVTVEYQVSSSEDDGYASNESLQNLDAGYLKVGMSAFAQPPYYICGMVFDNVDIPQGADIISAHLKIRSYSSGLTDLVYARIEAEATDSASAFDSSRHMGALPRISASVNWDHYDPWAKDTWYESPDIAAVIKEVINRSGWSTVNGSLTMLYSTREPEGGYRYISAYDRGLDFAPKLQITYVP